MTLSDIIELQALNIAKLFGNTKWFIIISLLIITMMYIILKYKKVSLIYFISLFIFYIIIFGVLFFKGIRIKSMLDTGEEIIKYINDYKNETMNYPETLDKLNLRDKEFIDFNYLDCCIEYKVHDSTLVKIKDEKGDIYKRIPLEAFSLIIRPENYPVYFIFNSSGTDFIASEIHDWEK